MINFLDGDILTSLNKDIKPKVDTLITKLVATLARLEDSQERLANNIIIKNLRLISHTITEFSHDVQQLKVKG